jgi:alcohol dehydrogenase (cytochrome c)
LFYVPLSESWAMYYLAETDPRGAMGLGGKEELGLGGETYLTALDYKTGKVVWKQKYPSLTGGGGTMGLLTTAGRLLFAGDAGGNFVARDPANGKPLWHSRIGNISNAPETYAVDGRQYVLVAVGDTLYAFSLY